MFQFYNDVGFLFKKKKTLVYTTKVFWGHLYYSYYNGKKIL